MKHLLNIIGLAGFAGLNYGIYQHFGEATTWMFAGSGLLLFSMRALQVMNSKGRKC